VAGQNGYIRGRMPAQYQPTNSAAAGDRTHDCCRKHDTLTMKQPSHCPVPWCIYTMARGKQDTTAIEDMRTTSDLSRHICDKKLSYRRGTARCSMSVEILSTAAKRLAIDES